jgi:hypothetical protein
MTGRDEPMSVGLAAAARAAGTADVTPRPLDTGWGHRHGLYLIGDGDRAVVLKRVEADGSSRLGTVKRLLMMRREIATYRALERRRWRDLRHPPLIATDGRRFLIVGYVPPAPRWPDDVGVRVVRALVEFHTALPDVRGVPRGVGAFGAHAPVPLLVRSTVAELRGGSPARAARIWGVAVRGWYDVVRAGGPRYAQHGDATFGNVVVDREGSVHLIDFQRVRRRQQLAFRDVVQLAMDPRNEAGVDPSLLLAYADLWCRTLGRPVSEARTQLRLALLLQTLYVQHSYEAATDIQRRWAPRFLEEVVLPDDRFDAWCRMVGLGANGGEAAPVGPHRR